MSITLSVVIISRNEAKNIARAIESVLLAVKGWPHTEILLVDSASTDETVDIARRYPINIIRLPSSWFLSATAGRHIGMCYTRGELVLHMDGDMELDSEWVDRSVAYAIEHPEVAAVGGYWRDIYIKDGQIVGGEDQFCDPQGRVMEAKYVGGASLYRRPAILQIGGFQPFIRGEEEVILCIGLRHAGYKVVRLPYLMSRHYCIPPQSLAGSLRRIRLDMWIGYGQVPRYYWGTPLFWTYLIERGTFVIPLTGMLLSIVTLLATALSGNIAFFGFFALFVLGIILVFAVRKHSLWKALLSCLVRVMISYSAVLGFLMDPHSPAEYPTEAEIVQVRSYGGSLCESKPLFIDRINDPEPEHRA